MRVKKEDLDCIYDVLARIALVSDFMAEEHKEELSNLIERIIQIFESYKEDEQSDKRIFSDLPKKFFYPTINNREKFTSFIFLGDEEEKKKWGYLQSLT